MNQKNLLLTICSLLTIWVMFPADSLQIDKVDQSPESFMERLCQFEKSNRKCILAKFNKEFHENELETQEALAGAYLFMRHLDVIKYSEYLFLLARTKKLDDKQKLEGEWLPSVGDRFKDDQRYRQELSSILSRSKGTSKISKQYNCAYPFLRLLFAMTVPSGAKFPLRKILDKDDMSLLKKLLKTGVNPNYSGFSFEKSVYDGSFYFCTSLDQAKLLFDHKADLEGQNDEFMPRG